jgi:CRP/FNR family transcriptional regulator
MLATAQDLNPSSISAVQSGFQPVPRKSVGLSEHLARGSVRRLEAKEHLFADGDPKVFAFKILSGALCLYKILPDGRRQVTEFAYAGDVIGFSFDQFETFSAQATVAARVSCVPLATLRRAAGQDPKLAMDLYEALARENSAMREHLVCVGQRSATERLVTFLLAISKRNGTASRDSDTIELPMTRADIGDFLGLTIETVSRTFSKLKSQRFIEINQGTTIRILNRDKLESLAENVLLV